MNSAIKLLPQIANYLFTRLSVVKFNIGYIVKLYIVKFLKCDSLHITLFKSN